MSHRATNWAIQQRGIKPAAKIVLWHLADRHNKDTGRCDPNQELLASDCEISRSSLNNQLKILEEHGLIKRENRVNKATNRQENTFYILGFDLEESQDLDGAVSKNYTRKAVSKKQQKPCPKNDQSRVQILDTYINPVNKPGIEPCVSEDPNHTQYFEYFWKEYPRTPNSRRDRALVSFIAKVVEGTDPQRIISGAKGYARDNEGNKPQFLKYPENWLDSNCFLDHDAGPSAQAKKWMPNEVTVEKVRNGTFKPQEWFGPNQALPYVEADMLSVEQWAKCGIHLKGLAHEKI